jgi:hypothetical protein
MTSLNFYTYLHRTKDTNEVFYVGKGKNNRAFSTKGRNPWWSRKVNKHGLIVEIVAWWETEIEALQHELFLIQCFESMGVTLTNIFKALGKQQDNMKMSPETRKKMSEHHKTKWANSSAEDKEAWGQLISKANKGRKLTEEHRKKLSAVRLGNPKASCKDIPVKCITTGLVYKSIKEASKHTQADQSHIVKCCKGKVKATKGLRFQYV